MALTATTPLTPLRKLAAHGVLINLDEATAAVFRDSFRQFGMDVTELKTTGATKLQQAKYDACVIALDDRAEDILHALRESKSNRRIVLFGVCNNVRDLVHYSRYGVNVVLEQPLDRTIAVRAIRSTHLLIAHEFRRYVRIPVVVPVDIQGISHPVRASSLEISAGGMSLRSTGKLSLGTPVEVACELPGMMSLDVRAVVCWARPEKGLVGLRFDPSDDRRYTAKKWIDDYLDLG